MKFLAIRAPTVTVEVMTQPPPPGPTDGPDAADGRAATPPTGLDYDLVHETVDLRCAGPGCPPELMRAPERTDDYDGDYGYDLAHDIPRPVRRP